MISNKNATNQNGQIHFESNLNDLNAKLEKLKQSQIDQKSNVNSVKKEIESKIHQNAINFKSEIESQRKEIAYIEINLNNSIDELLKKIELKLNQAKNSSVISENPNNNDKNQKDCNDQSNR